MSYIIMYFLNFVLTFFLMNRWIVSGHFPLSNLYESLMFLSWSFSTIYTITSFTLRGDLKTTLLPTISWSVMPITILTCAYAIFCIPKELQRADNLVPALQSNWLIMHVSVMILGYASLIIGSLFAFSLLLILHFEGNTNFLLSFYSSFAKVFGNNTSKINSSDQVTSEMALVSPTGNYGPTLSNSISLKRPQKTEIPFVTESPSKQNKSILSFGNLFGNLDLIPKTSGDAIIFLDNLSYRFIGLGFALLTLGIISGAVWANSAWGSYWSWDPKETWAFITWLTYAIYLHLRVSKGWSGKQSATVALFGFFIVWFCYLGVNLFGKGLHSYAFV